MSNFSEQKDDEIAWSWSINEQVTYYLRHDAFWIDRIKAKTFDSSDFNELLNRYSLKQGIGHAFLRNNFESIWPWLSALYSPALSDSFNEVNGRWQTATKELSQQMSDSGGKQVRSQMLWSATSKLLWFFHPELCPMYDKFTLRSLNQICAQRRMPVTSGNYMEHFSKLLSEARPKIQKAMALSPYKYIYESRVLDQYLWLIGSGKKEQILKKYEAGQSVYVSKSR